MSDNPLLSVKFQIPFDQVRAEHVEPGVRELIKQAQSHIDAIVNDDAPALVRQHDAGAREFDRESGLRAGVVRHLESVATTPELRAAWNVVEPEASAFYSQIPLNEGLWKKLQSLCHD